MRVFIVFNRCIIILILILSSSNYLNSQQVTPYLSHEIDSVVLKCISKYKIPGLSIGLVKDNKIIYLKGYGSKEVGKYAPVDSLTNFLTCSISKLFTATAIMQLVEDGKIDIHKKLVDYVPEFKMKGKGFLDITIEQMLTHTSGLPNIYNSHFIHPSNDSIALSEFAHKLKHKKLSYKPGVQLSEKTYSNTAYNILGLVIERVTHQPFSTYITESILKPIGMNQSSFFYQSIPKDRRSVPHKRNFITHKVKASHYYPDIPQDKPCGNLNSCSSDLCKWMIHMISLYDSNLNQSGIIKQSTLMNMWTTHKVIPGYTTSIGIGWWIVNSKKYGDYVFHDGNDPGYSASLIISPKNKFGIVLLCNALYPKEIIWNSLPFEIIDLFQNNWVK